MQANPTFVSIMKAILQSGSEYRIERKGDKILLNGVDTPADMKELRPGSWHILLDGKSVEIEVLHIDKASRNYVLRVNGKQTDVTLRDRFDDLLRELGMDNNAASRVGDLKAPMPGLVVDVPVAEGQSIQKGDTLVILEAMKMENALKATGNAVVKKISVKKGQAVEKNEVLVFLTPAE